MCGIFGIFGNIHEFEKKPELISDIKSDLMHRGPDSQKIIHLDGSILLSTRLSIQDKSHKSNMPFESNDKKWLLAFNGEITNHKLLRKEIDKNDWKTNSDTETIIEGISKDGISFLNKIEGMFSIVALNVIDNVVYIYRDYPGIKPLYYYDNNEFIVFSSEFPTLVRFLQKVNIPTELSKDTLLEYLIYRNTIIEPYTLVDKIKKVSPGQLLKYDIEKRNLSDISIHIYSQTTEESNLDNIFNQAIKDNIQSDQKMGMLLSGGVDSSTVLAKSLENGAEIEAFTLRYSDFQNSTFSEIPFSEFVCNHLNVNLNKIILNEEDFISLIPISIGEQDGNSMDPTIIAYNKIGKVVRSKNIKTVLSGTGSDEIFGSYEWLHAKDFTEFDEWMQLPFIKEFININSMDIDVIHEKAKNKRKKLIFKNNNDISFEDRLRTFGMNHLEADALVRIDLGLMNSSVEARVPLLNQRLVQFALSSQSMTSKQLIRDIGASLLPHEIYKRKKRGFPHPVYLWLQNSILRDYCYNSLKNSSISYLFNLKKIFNFLYNNSKPKNKKDEIINHSKAQTIWYIFAFAIWYDKLNIKLKEEYKK
ncbi:asparagine synthase (glutamine-hydrolyzing) [Staphylococcus haemolyticus]|uniref:asparagine synthase (glutamine-hydrolyzing) n=1 Tax=Staphylococcus TaxID=1279 RepID=UPI00051A3D0D|nr:MULTISPECIES: asparagine synthase (glutamine-hydrolyzing) [Staphylococcus]MDU5213790.1 asparagine synthase (glutamine-hydrolyzing) [Staphylococcus epidermidis]OFM92406.1 hypothetical protein HMPREF2639_00275 [Staphylococcus sp. HMSC078D05]MBK3941237.1 asparagine synthase (glutamine-hydrolyzing) [Staphylococcus haemolyticus]MBO1278443.1 asparagine synthase (glutamine-hydrolyzing) [Staphylococcus haemolyticus]MBS6062111.1 asparagine synthase (glutamine-hydrolyzing) [Staphylococcus sp.]